MGYEKLILEKENGYWVATIDNPPANALGEEVLVEMDDLLTSFGEDTSSRALIITGAGGKIFSAGADIRQLEKMRSGAALKINGQQVFSKIEKSCKPVIAALQGSAFGGGMELALSCHLRILSSSAVMGLPEVKLGILPGWGGTQRLPRLIGKTRALEMMLTGESLSAEQALTYGLINKVVPVEEVLPEARLMASRFACGAPLAMGKILGAVQEGIEVTIEEGLKIEESGFRSIIMTEDAKEGTEAFLQKRKANFQGR